MDHHQFSSHLDQSKSKGKEVVTYHNNINLHVMGNALRKKDVIITKIIETKETKKIVMLYDILMNYTSIMS